MRTLLVLVSLLPAILATAETPDIVLEVSDRGAPVTGSYDLELAVYDAREGGSLIARWMATGVEAERGRLVTPSDLPPGTLSVGLWVEARVRAAGEGPMERLPGRVPLKAAEQAACQVTGVLSVTDRIGVGTATPAGALHIVTTSSPPIGLPFDENGLLLGSDTGGDRWVQSYGGPLVFNPQGNQVGIGDVAAGVQFNVEGLIRADGYLQPGSGGENLRILRGRVAADGSISGGTGFTVSHSATGIYTIFPDEAFSSAPSVTATVFNAAGGSVTVSANASNQFELTTRDPQGGFANRDIEFIAVGNP